MTYGEAHIAEQHSLVMEDGVWIKKVRIASKPKPMSRKLDGKGGSEAGRYYNTKMFAFWMDFLDEKLSLAHKQQIISLFMFGNTDKHKLFKGNDNESI